MPQIRQKKVAKNKRAGLISDQHFPIYKLKI